MTSWLKEGILTEDRLPEKSGRVFMYNCGDTEVVDYSHEDKRFYCYDEDLINCSVNPRMWMPIPDDCEEALDYKKIRREFYLWQKGAGDAFTNALYNLISKAYADNLISISLGFRTHVRTWSDWMRSEDKDQFLIECAGVKENKND